MAKTATVSLKIPASQHEQLEKLCTITGHTVHSLVRHIIGRFLEEDAPFLRSTYEKRYGKST